MIIKKDLVHSLKEQRSLFGALKDTIKIKSDIVAPLDARWDAEDEETADNLRANVVISCCD